MFNCLYMRVSVVVFGNWCILINPVMLNLYFISTIRRGPRRKGTSTEDEDGEINKVKVSIIFFLLPKPPLFPFTTNHSQILSIFRWSSRRRRRRRGPGQKKKPATEEEDSRAIKGRVSIIFSLLN